MLLAHKDILLKLDEFEKQIIQNSQDVALIFETLRQLLNPPKSPSRPLGYRRKDKQ